MIIAYIMTGQPAVEFRHEWLVDLHITVALVRSNRQTEITVKLRCYGVSNILFLLKIVLKTMKFFFITIQPLHLSEIDV